MIADYILQFVNAFLKVCFAFLIPDDYIALVIA